MLWWGGGGRLLLVLPHEVGIAGYWYLCWLKEVGMYILRTPKRIWEKIIIIRIPQQGPLSTNLSVRKDSMTVSPMMNYHRFGSLFMPSMCRFGRWKDRGAQKKGWSTAPSDLNPTRKARAWIWVGRMIELSHRRQLLNPTLNPAGILFFVSALKLLLLSMQSYCLIRNSKRSSFFCL